VSQRGGLLGDLPGVAFFRETAHMFLTALLRFWVFFPPSITVSPFSYPWNGTVDFCSPFL